MNKPLPTGKLSPKILQKLIAHLPTKDANIVIPPGIGLDAAGIKIGSKLVAITTDPITLATDKIGTYSVAVNANDVACLGCKPKWYSATLLLPVGTTEEQLTAIWKNLGNELKRYDIQAIGGHTEITPTVNTPVIIGQMIGENIGDKLLDVRNGKPKDKILLWQPIAIEGTALLAKKCYDQLLPHFGKKKLRILQNMITDPGICIWPLVKKLMPMKGIIAFHDPTEGGIASALHEIADACNYGLSIDADAIPILPATERLSEILHFDPLGLLASGSLLILCDPKTVNKIIDKVSDETLSIIGEITAGKARQMKMNGIKKPLPRFDTDEIVRLIA